MDQITWWTAFGAIAQAAGAAATFAAVVVALWTTASERKLKARLTAGIRVTFVGDGSPGRYWVAHSVLNTGLRPLTVTMVGWRSGWLPWGPKALTYRYGIQMTEFGTGKTVPFDLAPSASGTCLTSVAAMKAVGHSEASREIFQRRLPLLGWSPIYAQVSISGSKPMYARAERPLCAFLRTNEHPDIMTPSPALGD